MVCPLQTEIVYSLLAKWIPKACGDEAVSRQLLCLLSKFFVSPKWKKKLLDPALATEKKKKPTLRSYMHQTLHTSNHITTAGDINFNQFHEIKEIIFS